MKLLNTLFLFVILVSAVSCRNERTDITGYMKERDSIMQENRIKTQQLNELNSIIATVASGLDSIAVQENMLYTGKSRDGVPLSRQQILANLSSMTDILARQRQKIQALQDSLAARNTSQSVEKLQHVITFLNQQLAEKDRVIHSLRADLNSSRKDMKHLYASLDDMRTRAERAESRQY